MKAVKNLCSKKNIQKIMGLLAALAIFIAISEIFNYLYFEDDYWTRILWHNLYEDKGTIDNIYLGSSHVYSDLNPAILDDLNGQYNFNLSTPDQYMNGSYYLLREADRLNTLSHVYLELYFKISVSSADGTDPIYESYQKNWINTDYMHFSTNKVSYMLAIISDTGKYEDIFFPFIRYREQLGNWDFINRVGQTKRNDSHRAYEYREFLGEDVGYNEYLKQGYWYSTIIVPETNFNIEQTLSMKKDPMGKTSEEYLRKIIDYCQRRDIPITLFVSPIPDLKLVSLERYDHYIDQINAIAQQYQIPFYDFNLAKEEYLSLRPNEHFRDLDHLNANGANIFTPFFSEVMSGDPSENDKYFYSSYEEKLKETTPSIYGIYYQNLETTDGRKKLFYIASNREEGMEYKISITTNEGDQYMIQDFSKSKQFTVPAHEHGVCIIEAITADNPGIVQRMKINY